MRKVLANRDGFTMMELLVGINISFIVITMLVSVYLFLFKFMLTTSKNLEAKLNITSGMQTLVSELYKNESFELWSENDSLWVKTENARLIQFQPDSIMLNDICLISDVESYELNIALYNGDKKTVVDGKIVENKLFGESQFTILSFEIKNMKLAVVYKDHVYRADYYQPGISAKRFANITNDYD